MFKAHVGLSRQITHDSTSTSYTINIEGEIPLPLDQPAAALQQVHNLFELAKKALAQEIVQGENSLSRREEKPQASEGNGQPSQRPFPSSQQSKPADNQTSNGQVEAATEKQIRYVHSIAKRMGISQGQLENRIAEVLGQRVALNLLTKKEAGRVIDSLTKSAPASSQR